jgi:hypothetical protein
MKHAAIRSAFAVGLLLALSAPALAQQDNTLTFRYRATTAWPASAGTPGTMTRCVSGDFNGDGVTDVIALVGGSPVLMLAPDSWESVSVFGYPSSCLDLDRVPAPGDAKNPFVTVSSAGLIEAKDNGAVGYYYTTLSSDSRWTGATMVRSGYLNSNTTPDFIGMCPAHDSVPTKIVVMMDYAGTDTTSSFNLTGLTVYDIGFVHYDGASDNRIWVLDSYGVEVFTASGARIKRFARTSTLGDAVCTFWKNGDSREHLAWFRTRSGTSDQELVELHWEPDPSAAQSVTAEHVITGSDRVVHAIPVASSYLSIGSQSVASDLLLCHLDDYTPLRLFHETTSIGQSTFDPSLLNLIEDGSAPSDLMSAAGSATMPSLLVADLSHDAAEDMLLPIQTSTGLYFLDWRGGPIDEAATAVSFIQAPSMAAATDGLNELTAGIDLLDDPSQNGANCLEIVVWSCPAQSTADPVTYTAEKHYFYYQGLDSNGTPIYPTITSNCVWPKIRLHLRNTSGGDDADDFCFPLLYWMEVRQSALQADGTLRAKSPTYVGAISSRLSGLNPWYESGFSLPACMGFWASAQGSSCWSSIPADAGCIPNGQGTSAVVAPGSMTRHRLAPTGTPPTPASPTHGDLQ